MKETTDVVYAIDSSRRVDADMYKRMKNLVKASLKSYDISPSDTRASVVGFGAQATVALPLSEGTDTGSIETALDSLNKIGGPRRMNKALRLIRSNIFANPVNARPNAKKVVILLTTGKNSGDGTGELPSVASDLRSEGVEVIAVVIGKDKDPDEINAITGKSGNAVYVDDMSKLPLAFGTLEAKVREIGGICLTSTTVFLA